MRSSPNLSVNRDCDMLGYASPSNNACFDVPTTCLYSTCPLSIHDYYALTLTLIPITYELTISVLLCIQLNYFSGLTRLLHAAGYDRIIQT